MKAPKVKRIKGEAVHAGGNPYRSKPAVPGDDELGFGTPRNWYGKKSASMDMEFKGRPAFDSGHIDESR